MTYNDYDDLYFAILNITSGPQDDTHFDLLSESAQALYAAAIFNAEIMNGGLCQFFINCGSGYAARVTNTLNAIGLGKIGELYESFLTDHQITLADIDSFTITTTTEESIKQYTRYPFDDFNNAYVALWDELGFSAAMLQYAQAHPEAFVQP
jgi:hypothetical protein